MLLVAIAGFLVALFTSAPFFEWAFARHQNVLSWIARPLLLLPFIFFAWRRSLNGILISILALLTSMIWFPAPAEPDPQVAAFLAMEKTRIRAGLDLKNLLGLAAILLYGGALAAAFWRRSLLLGGVVVASGALAKALWGLAEGGDSGTVLLPFAFGSAILIISILVCIGWQRRQQRQRTRPTASAPQTPPD